MNKQRSQLRATHPDLPFTEITKMLAAQWAQLSQDKKGEMNTMACTVGPAGSSSAPCATRSNLLQRQHLQRLTGEFKKDSAAYSKHPEPLEEEKGQDSNEAESEEEAEGPESLPLRSLHPERSFASLDLCFSQGFVYRLLKIKELELRELRRTVERAGAEEEALQRQLVEFQVMAPCACRRLGARSAHMAQLVGGPTWRCLGSKE
uniref:SWI/SNF-related matrix-associated actin-dependent regulator of chromatin subfamily E member 1-related-like n=1 Tax=Macaca mulatta TaxID=9544 RepID=UPI0010A27657|nr:SWI/SNF-related matrix-associated actin-dependent regulator of chromatin subfamily E member 1-related-like [Macaca mulatta]